MKDELFSRINICLPASLICYIVIFFYIFRNCLLLIPLKHKNNIIMKGIEVMYNKEILNYIFNHHELNIKELTTETIPLYVKKYERLSKSSFNKKQSIYMIESQLNGMYHSLTNINGNEPYEYYISVMKQLSDIRFNYLKNFFFNNKISITIPNDYVNHECMNKAIQTCINNGFVINIDTMDDMVLTSLEIEVNTNIDISNRYELSEFNLSTVKQFRKCHPFTKIDYSIDHDDKFNSFIVMKNHLSNNIFNKDNTNEHYNILKNLIDLSIYIKLNDDSDIIALLNHITDMNILYINIIELIKDSNGPAEELFEMYLTFFITLYNKMMNINSDKRNLYRSFLSNINKVSQVIDSSLIAHSYDSLKYNALLKLKRIIVLIADKIKED